VKIRGLVSWFAFCCQRTPTKKTSKTCLMGNQVVGTVVEVVVDTVVIQEITTRRNGVVATVVEEVVDTVSFFFLFSYQKKPAVFLVGGRHRCSEGPVAGLRLIDLPPRRCSLPSFFGGRGGSNGVPLLSFSTKSLR
jgi:hypothetical protein